MLISLTSEIFCPNLSRMTIACNLKRIYSELRTHVENTSVFFSEVKHNVFCAAFFFFFKLIFDICEVEGPAQVWQLFYQRLGVTEIIDFQVCGHVYEILRQFSLISTPESSSTYLNQKKRCEE